MNNTITVRKTIELKPLSQIKSIHRWDVDDPEFCAFRDDIREHGIKHPIQITSQNDIVDGMTRWMSAKLLQLEEVPVEIIPDDQVDTIILRELVLKRNLTKGQLAYSLVPLIGPAFDEARRREYAGIKANPPHSVGRVGNGLLKRVKTPGEWAAEMGFGVELMRQAKWLHDQIAAWPDAYKWGDSEQPVTLRVYVEARLFDHDSPMGVGACNKAVGYLIEARKHPAKANGGKPAEPDRQMSLFEQTLLDQLHRWEYWQQADDAAKKSYFEQVRAEARKLPADQAQEMADYHARLAKEFSAAAIAAQKQQQ